MTWSLTAALATIPSRVDTLAQAVDSLLPQVDRLFVYCNGHEELPECLRHSRIETAHSRDAGDDGDAGKFHWASAAGGVHLTCDDDIIYPADYARVMAAAVEADPLSAFGVLGARFVEPIRGYYRSRLPRFAVRYGLSEPVRVHVLGTGTLAFSPSATAFPGRQIFAAPNMADVWFAVWARTAGVSCYCVARPPAWLCPLAVSGPAIYDTFRRTQDDQIQTKAVAALSWPTLGPVTAEVIPPPS